MIAALEDDLGRPVIIANQALMWNALSAAGAHPSSVTENGRRFRNG